MSTLTAPFARIFRSEKRDEAKTSVTSVKKSGAKNDGLIARTRLGAWLNRPMTSFHLVVATAALLTTLGLIMVLSARASSRTTTTGPRGRFSASRCCGSAWVWSASTSPCAPRWR